MCLSFLWTAQWGGYFVRLSRSPTHKVPDRGLSLCVECRAITFGCTRSHDGSVVPSRNVWCKYGMGPKFPPTMNLGGGCTFCVSQQGGCPGYAGIALHGKGG